MSTWHVTDALLEAYVGGEVDAVEAASVEQHLSRCAPCRAGVTPLVDRSLLDRAWAGVREAVESPPPPLAIRLAQRWGLPEPTAVLLAATASLRTAWLASATVALAFAAAAAGLSDVVGIAPFLLVAPLVPVLGVAASYGPHEDPLEGLVATSPYGRTRLVLVRTLAILVTALPFTTLLGLSLPGPLWVAAAWLGPALTLVPVTLALSSFVGPRNGAGLVVICWSAVVVFSSRTMPATWPVEARQQLVYLSLAVVAALVLAARARLDRQIGALL